jgi:hypothetical protein
MKTLVKTVTAYNFNELSEDAKWKAKREFLDFDRQPEWFSEDVVLDLNETYGLKNLKTYFSLSNCQGDGLCLYGKIYFSELANDKFKKIAFAGLHHTQIKSISESFMLTEIEFDHNDRYYYAGSTRISDNADYNATDKQQAIIDKIVENVKKWYFQFCKQWEQYGYDYFYEISDEDMEEVCKTNDYMFFEDGKMVGCNYTEQEDDEDDNQ